MLFKKSLYSLLKVTVVGGWKNLCPLIWSHFQKRNLHLSLKCSRRKQQDKIIKQSFEADNVESEVDSLLADTEHRELVQRVFHLSVHGHQVAVVNPYPKWGRKRNYLTTPDLQLEEAVSLVRTLHNWIVVEKVSVPLRSPDSMLMFGSGQLDEIQQKILQNDKVTAVFISVPRLKGTQQKKFEDIFHLPVYDRYTLILHIFQQHAKSRVSQLQVAVAEIPYLRLRLHGISRGHLTSASDTDSVWYVGGTSQTSMDARHLMLDERERKLKEEMERIKIQRDLLRQNRNKLEIPSIAVIGYTNCGKTSLIKALSLEDTIKPMNKLFATLDVTVHGAQLPCHLQVVYVDTVGFLADIPTTLIQAFRETLFDALIADLIIHVVDVSHPDLVNQMSIVKKTLIDLELSDKLIENMITVGNKIDKLTQENKNAMEAEDMFLISAKNGTGLDALEMEIENKLLKVTDMRILTFRVPSGRDESRWLYKNVAVSDVYADPKDPQYLCMQTVISKLQYIHFHQQFGKPGNSWSLCQKLH